MRVRHGQYTFEVDVDVDDDDAEATITIMAQQRQPYPCVRIVVPLASPKADLQALNYYASCFAPSKLDPGAGTVAMMRVALAFTLAKYPHVTSFDLQDETFAFVPGDERPLITVRRLLQGQLGWYEEHFGAMPLSKIVTYVRKPAVRKKIDDWIAVHPAAAERAWWTPTNVHQLANAINAKIAYEIFGTSWTIPADTVRAYGIAYDVVKEQDGGGLKRRLARFLRQGQRYHINPHLIGRGKYYM